MRVDKMVDANDIESNHWPISTLMLIPRFPTLI